MKRTLAAVTLVAAGLLGVPHVTAVLDTRPAVSEEAGITLMRGINDGKIGTWLITDTGRIFFPD